MAKQYNNYSSLIDFTRASSGTALRPISYGDELVVNGTFDTDTTGWSVVGGGSISSTSGKLRVTSDGSLTRAQQSFSTVVGKTYKIAFSAYKGTANNYLFYAGSSTAANNYVNQSAPDGSFEKTFVATGTSCWITVYCGTSGGGLYSEYDNVSVREVLFDQPDGTLTLFNHPTNVPRIEYDSDGNRLGLLVEESRTNLITYSDDLTQWTASNGTITQNNVLSPDGVTFADTFVSTSNFSRLQLNFSASGALDYTVSFWVKTTATNLQLNIYNLTTSTAISAYGYSSQITSGEWSKVKFTFTADAAGAIRFQILRDFPEGSEASFYLIQAEQGSFATSAIPTSGSTATRSADVASLSTSAFGYRQDEGALYVEADTFGVGSGTSKYMVQMDDATNNNRHTLYISSTDERRWFTGASGSTQQVTGSGIATNNVQFKAIGVYKENDFALVVDGGSVVTDTVGTTPNGISIARIGVNLVSGEALNGHIKSLKYYPRRLTNAQLQELTS